MARPVKAEVLALLKDVQTALDGNGDRSLLQRVQAMIQDLSPRDGRGATVGYAQQRFSKQRAEKRDKLRQEVVEVLSGSDRDHLSLPERCRFLNERGIVSSTRKALEQVFAKSSFG